jgi:hypothetical protein
MTGAIIDFSGGWPAAAVPGWRPPKTLRSSSLPLPSGSPRSFFSSAAIIRYRPPSALPVMWFPTRARPTPARAGAWRRR